MERTNTNRTISKLLMFVLGIVALSLFLGSADAIPNNIENCKYDTAFVREYSNYVTKNLIPEPNSDDLSILILKNCNYQVSLKNRALFTVDNSTYEVYDIADSLKPLSEEEAISLSRLYNRILHIWADSVTQLYAYQFNDNWLITYIKPNPYTKTRPCSIYINKYNYRLEH